MAQRIITQLVSDLSGEDIIDDKGETVQFSYRGVDYTIDLTEKEAAGFDESIAMYVEHGVRVSGRRKTSSPRASSGAADYIAKDVRAWANDNGIEVPERGRIPADVIEKYKAAQ